MNGFGMLDDGTLAEVTGAFPTATSLDAAATDLLDGMYR